MFECFQNKGVIYIERDSVEKRNGAPNKQKESRQRGKKAKRMQEEDRNRM